jgi:hypothetical protein
VAVKARHHRCVERGRVNWTLSQNRLVLI